MLIEAIAEEDWTPIPYWLPGGAAVAETTYTPFQHKEDATPVRLIVAARQAGARLTARTRALLRRRVTLIFAAKILTARRTEPDLDIR